MRLIFRSIVWLIVLGAASAAIAAALVWHLASRSLPNYDDAWQVEGLAKPVRVIRDRMATPHILAETDADAFFALGWAHAQDRLWQMELARRSAKGRLSELFGVEALPVDRLMRAMDIGGLSQRIAAAQPPEVAALMEAYADGVNARLRGVNRRALGRGAPEFFLFGDATIAPWTPSDSIAIGKLMALRMTSSALDEMRRARLMSELPAELLRDIDPVDPQSAILALPARRNDGAPAASPGLSLQGPGGASNAWAVDGSRAASGAPLLAADPHLWLSSPGVWYLARLSSPGFDVIGATIPGLPLVLMGRNRGLAWGLTTAQVDDQDLFLEELKPGAPGSYRVGDDWAEFEERNETIAVAGGDNVSMTFQRSRHGPVIPPGAEFAFDSIAPPGYAVALAWTALEEEDGAFKAGLDLMRATRVQEGLEAVAAHSAPAQNVVLADRETIGIVLAGRAPRRSADSRSKGRVPSLGRYDENGWLGYFDPSASPREITPESGAVANANNRITDAEFPRHLTYDWPAPYRISRIEDRLGSRRYHSLESFREIQQDAVSSMARSVLPLIARDLWWGEGEQDGAPARRRRAALERLADWNGEASIHDPEPLIFHAWMRHLTRWLAEDEMGALFEEVDGVRPLFIERVFHDIEGAARWCDITKTARAESCAEMSQRALDDALTELEERFGADMSAWRWGDAHRAVLRHAPFGYGDWLGILLNIQYESAGDAHSILVGAMPDRGAAPEENIRAPGFRMVVDFAEPDSSVFAISTGASGHPLSRHYDDFNDLWRRGDDARMSLEVEEARAGAVGVTELTPR